MPEELEAALASLDADIPTKPPPAWLRSDAAVYSAAHKRVVRIIQVVDRIAVFGAYPKSIDWVEAIENGELTKADDIDVGAAIISRMGAIPEPKHKEIATELFNSALLSDCQVLPPEEAVFVDLPQEMEPELAQALPFPSLYRHQAEAYKALVLGKSLLLSTATASGKTLSFIPGIIDAILKARIEGSRATALLLYPLKELANDQFAAFNKVIDKLRSDVRIGVLTGDTPKSSISGMFHQCDIVLCSPDKLHYTLYYLWKRDDGWEGMRRFFLNLQFVVLDEIHSYVGSFGANVINLMRRIRLAVDQMHERYCAPEEIEQAAEDLDDESFWLKPEEWEAQKELPARFIATRRLQFIMSTATIGNPMTTAIRLSGLDESPSRIHWISESAAGSKGRTILTVAGESLFQVVTEIVQNLIKANMKGLTFCNTRALAKMMQNGLRSEMRDHGLDHLIGSSSCFYGSMKTQTRGDIMTGIRTGRIKHLFSTSALEAGVDLPDMDYVIILGFPGTLMSFGQRIGRCGRNRPGLVLYFPLDGFLDSFYQHHPELFIEGEPEVVNSNPDYPVVLGLHMICAAKEVGIPVSYLSEYFGPVAPKVSATLLEKGSVRVGGRNLLNESKYPHYDANLRGGDATSVALTVDGRTEIESLDWGIAIGEAHPGAIYKSTGLDGALTTYRVRDLSRAEAALERADDDSNRLTQANKVLSVKPKEFSGLSKKLSTPWGDLYLDTWWGNISVSVLGYKEYQNTSGSCCTNPKCRMKDIPQAAKNCASCGKAIRRSKKRILVHEENFEEPLVSSFGAPIMSVIADNRFLGNASQSQLLHQAEWVREYGDHDLPNGAMLSYDYDHRVVAMHSLMHLFPLGMALATLFDKSDVDNYIRVSAEGEPVIDQFPDFPNAEYMLSMDTSAVGFLYDSRQNGSGATETVAANPEKMIARAGEIVRDCQCKFGCPKCIIDHSCIQRNGGISKPLALDLIDAILS